MIVYFVLCIMDSIQGMRLIQILFFYPLCSVCGPKPCLLSGIQFLHEIRWGFVSGFSVVLINIASEFPNNLGELILTMYPHMFGMILIPCWWKLREKRCDFFCGHTGSLYQRQEGNLVLFILRGAEQLLNSSYTKSTPRIHALPSDLQVIRSINLFCGGGIPWTGTSFLPHPLSNPVNWEKHLKGYIAERFAKPLEILRSLAQWRAKSWHSVVIILCRNFSFWFVLSRILSSMRYFKLYFSKILKQEQWYGCKKSTTDTWTVSIMLRIAIYSCGAVCN